MKWKFSLSLLFTAVVTTLAGGDEAGYHEDYQPSPYHYKYKVHDDKAYLDFGAKEEGDGNGDVHGHYHVQLPDGRLQHVSYHVDDYNGYIADVSYDGHAEHPSNHEVSHGIVGGGQRFGKKVNLADPGLNTPIRVGKTLSTKSREPKISSSQFSRSREGKKIDRPSLGRFTNGARKPTHSFFSRGLNEVPSIPVTTIESSGETTVGNDGSVGSIDSIKSSNPFISRRPIGPQLSTIPKENPGKHFVSFGPNPNRARQENSFQGHRNVPELLEPHQKDSSGRNGKSGRQNFDEKSSNFFGSSSNSKPVVHGNSETQNTLTKSKTIFESKFTEPASNSFFSTVEKSHEPTRDLISASLKANKSSRDFDSFSTKFGQNRAENKPEKSFDSFNPILAKKTNNNFSGRINTFGEDTGFFQASGQVKSLGSIKSSDTQTTSPSLPARTDTINRRTSKPIFPVRQQVAPTKINKHSPTSNQIRLAKPKQASPRFKPRRIGFGKNHPVLLSLKEHRRNSLRTSNSRKGSVEHQPDFGHQGSFGRPVNRQQFGRALGEKPVRNKSPVQSSAQELGSGKQGQRAFITHKALPF